MWYEIWAKKLRNRFQQIYVNLYAFWSRICWKATGHLIYLHFRLIRFSETVKIIFCKINEQRQIDGKMVKHGTLFLSFGLILLGTKIGTNDSPIRILNMFPSPPSDWSTTVTSIVGIIILATIIIFFGIFNIFKLAKRIKRNKRFFLATAVCLLCLLLLFGLWLIPPITISCYVVIGEIIFGISVIFIFAVFIKWLSTKLTKYIEEDFPFIYWSIFVVVYIIGLSKGLAEIPEPEIFWPSIIGRCWFLIIGVLIIKSAWQTDIHN